MAIANLTGDGKEKTLAELYCSEDLAGDITEQAVNKPGSAIKHISVHYCISVECSDPSRPSLRVFSSSSIQTLASLSGDNRSHCWFCFGAPRYRLLDVYHLRTLEFLSPRICFTCSDRLHFVWNVFVDFDRNKCGLLPVSRHCVRV